MGGADNLTDNAGGVNIPKGGARLATESNIDRLIRVETDAANAKIDKSLNRKTEEAKAETDELVRQACETLGITRAGLQAAYEKLGKKAPPFVKRLPEKWKSSAMGAGVAAQG